jgi:hypothetical protein
MRRVTTDLIPQRQEELDPLNDSTTATTATASPLITDDLAALLARFGPELIGQVTKAVTGYFEEQQEKARIAAAIREAERQRQTRTSALVALGIVVGAMILSKKGII